MEGLKVVIDARDRHGDGFHHDCFGSVSRRHAGGGGGVGGGDGSGGFDSSVVLKLVAITVRDSTEASKMKQ